MRQAVLQNRDIIKLFERLRVSDSFLLQTQRPGDPVPEAGLPASNP